MNFLKFSFLIIFASLVVGLTPTFLKFILNKEQILEGTVVLPKIKTNSISTTDSTSRKNQSIRLIIYKDTKIPIYVADDETKRSKGLGGLTSIPSDYGMFFIFDYADYQSIWMKDMLFPIDIIWIDENYKIVHIERDVSPNTYPKIFTSPIKALYVLELNAGISSHYSLKIGDSLFLK